MKRYLLVLLFLILNSCCTTKIIRQKQIVFYDSVYVEPYIYNTLDEYNVDSVNLSDWLVIEYDSSNKSIYEHVISKNHKLIFVYSKNKFDSISNLSIYSKFKSKK